MSESSRVGPGEFLFKELSSRTVQQVLMTLSVSHLAAIPVFNSQRHCYAMYGLRDLLQSLLEIVHGVDPHTPIELSLGSKMKSALGQKIKVNIASYLAEKHEDFVSVDFQKNLYDVVCDMLENKRSEVSITTDHDVLLNVINLDTVVRFIYINRLRMHPMYFSATVGQLGLGGKVPLFTIKDTDPVVEAFKLIYHENVPAVAVLNSAGELAGCINLHDVLIIFKPKRTILDLFLTAKEFIELGMYMSRGVIPPPFATCATCTEETTLQQIVDLSVRNRVRNVFFLDENKSVTRVITTRDIVEAFFSMSPAPLS